MRPSSLYEADSVEIGAGTAIDRGTIQDTVVDEGTNIDNLAQVAHNVSIGQHCMLVAQSTIAGSSTLGDLVVLGGRAAVSDNSIVGERAQIAAQGAVHGVVPPGARRELWRADWRLWHEPARIPR